jgi:hypothetical protein
MEFTEQDTYWLSLLSPFFGLRLIVWPELGPLSFLIGGGLVLVSPLLVPIGIIRTPFRLYQKHKDYKAYLEQYAEGLERRKEVDKTHRMQRADVGWYPEAPLNVNPPQSFLHFFIHDDQHVW